MPRRVRAVAACAPGVTWGAVPGPAPAVHRPGYAGPRSVVAAAVEPYGRGQAPAALGFSAVALDRPRSRTAACEATGAGVRLPPGDGNPGDGNPTEAPAGWGDHAPALTSAGPGAPQWSASCAPDGSAGRASGAGEQVPTTGIRAVRGPGRRAHRRPRPAAADAGGPDLTSAPPPASSGSPPPAVALAAADDGVRVCSSSFSGRYLDPGA